MASPPLLIWLALVCRRSSSNTGKSWAVVGVTEEIAPGCRVSTTSCIASMLRPEVISELRLTDHGLRMIPCDPAIQVPFSDADVVPWWVDRERARQEFSRISTRERGPVCGGRRATEKALSN
jgi:hypothetical protein